MNLMRYAKSGQLPANIGQTVPPVFRFTVPPMLFSKRGTV
jgi:hypothetical protein